MRRRLPPLLVTTACLTLGALAMQRPAGAHSPRRNAAAVTPTALGPDAVAAGPLTPLLVLLLFAWRRRFAMLWYCGGYKCSKRSSTTT